MSASKQFVCLECGNEYNYNKNLRQHVSKVHPEKLNVIAPITKRHQTCASKLFVCLECGKEYNCNKNLRQHVSKVHPDKLDVIAPIIKRHQSSASKQFICVECGNGYNYYRNLRHHVSKVHPEKFNVIAPILKRQQPYAYHCEMCNKYFNYASNLKRHQRDYHGEGSARKKIMTCSLCSHEATTELLLFEHLESVHEVKVKSEELQFSSFDDFKNWKQEIEETTGSMFVAKCGSYIGFNKSVSHYYACHRSGNFVSKGKGIRHIKLQGSNKIGGVCPAKIQARQAEDGKCLVKFISTHVGHKHDLSHLGLSEKERDSIAADIANKTPFQAILDKIRDSVSDAKLQRIHLLTRQDLYNIERCYNLCSSSVRHHSDGTSVEAWVHEMNSSDSPCVLFYKPQDMLSDSYTELKNTDFVLIIMNNAQGELLKKFGNDCVCIDRTHGLNTYGFELITLVIDDMRQGFPCAFLISNRSDFQVLSIFFQCIKSVVGNVSPKVFMSDLAESFYNAWVAIMKAPTMRLYCTWHIDRAWRKNINKVKGQEKQVDVYRIVRTLLEERDATAFETMLPTVIDKLKCDPDISEFASYFQENYVHNAESWANCHRLYTGLNTNMHIERMHHTLKYMYLHRKHVKHLDKAIVAIMSFVKDKLFDRLIVLMKGKLSSKIKDIRRRHKESMKINKDIIIREDSGWKIPSSSKVTEMYFVQDNDMDCTCKLICSECNTCIHRYSCTCVDSSIKWNMCKHIHSICQFQVRNEHTIGHSEDINDIIIDTKDFFILNEKEEILAQDNKEESHNCSVSLSEQTEKFACEFWDAIMGISTTAEVEIVKKHMAFLKARLATVRNQS